MTGQEEHRGASRRRFWARPGFWINLAVVAVFFAGAAGIQRWRAAQFEGWGLSAVYYEGSDFSGKVWRRGVEPFIDYSDKTDAHFKKGVFSVEWSGSIFLPRTGRYSFATESDDGSWVELDGRVIVDNGGTHGPRKRETAHMLQAGLYSFKVRYFQAGVGAKMRLFWSPAGRRGGPEYIPPTLLFPVSPSQADHNKASPIPPRDWPALLMLILLATAAALLLLRGPLRRGAAAVFGTRQGRIDLVVFLLLFVGALSVRAWDLHEAGRTWDEDVYWAAGRNYVQNLLAADWRAESWQWNNEHPGLGKWLYGPGTLVTEAFTAARMISALVGALTCALLFLAGRDLISRRVGIIGACLAAVMPHIIAHHKIIGLETPTGLLYLLTIWFFFRGLRREGNSGYHVAAALSAGLLVATRVSNISVVVVLLFLYLGVNMRGILRRGRFPMPVTLGLAPAVALISFFLVWPYLWENPMMHLGEMLVHWEPDKYLEWFFGKKQKPTWYYFPLYFSVTTPVAVLAAWFVSLARIGVIRDRGHLTLLLWYLAPFIVMFSPLARDGVRYLLPSLLATCLMAAAGLDWLAAGVARVARKQGARTAVAAFGGAGLTLYMFYCGSTVHPYYLDYYNEASGGPARVARNHTFEIGWWGEGIKEACDYIGRVAPEGARVWGYVHPTHVIALRDDLKRVDGPGEADYVMFNDLFNTRPEMPEHHVVHVVRAAGAPLVWIYQRNDRRGR